jgi:acyl-coenzyme A synthetase/AMP-(fatty) acid ligase
MYIVQPLLPNKIKNFPKNCIKNSTTNCQFSEDEEAGVSSADVEPTDISAIFWSSGTTGIPKETETNEKKLKLKLI